MLRSPAKKVPPEIQALIDRLREQVAFAERKGQTDTAHHTMLDRVLKEYGKPVEVEKEKDDGK
jgi:hypothetical protein